MLWYIMGHYDYTKHYFNLFVTSLIWSPKPIDNIISDYNKGLPLYYISKTICNLLNDLRFNPGFAIWTSYLCILKWLLTIWYNNDATWKKLFINVLIFRSISGYLPSRIPEDRPPSNQVPHSVSPRSEELV